jgi:hypothetical protein
MHSKAWIEYHTSKSTYYDLGNTKPINEYRGKSIPWKLKKERDEN